VKAHPRWATVLTSRSKARHYGSMNADTLLVGAVAGLIWLPTQGGSAPFGLFPAICPPGLQEHGFRSPSTLFTAVDICTVWFATAHSTISAFLFRNFDPRSSAGSEVPQHATR
jgi:hypothetical protein